MDGHIQRGAVTGTEIGMDTGYYGLATSHFLRTPEITFGLIHRQTQSSIHPFVELTGNTETNA